MDWKSKTAKTSVTIEAKTCKIFTKKYIKTITGIQPPCKFTSYQTVVSKQFLDND